MEFKLIIKKLNNTLSKEEELTFNEWYAESANHRLFFKKVQQNFDKDLEEVDVESAWMNIEKNLRPKTKRLIFPKFVAAASVILIASLAYYFVTNDNSSFKSPPDNKVTHNNIAPGTDKAILTLEDGTDIALEKGQNYISNNLSSNGEEIVYTKAAAKPEIAYNYLTIPRGGQYQIELSDGTQVWLNSESKLKYPVNFIDGETREVQLVYGEAYFDVSPSTEHNGDAFKVLHDMQEVQVLGTEFNIKAYKDEKTIYTTLVEGKVSVFDNIKHVALNPNQQSVLETNSNEILIKEVDVLTEISWVKGDFVFRRLPLKQIIKTLSRWYDVEINIENKSLEDTEFTGELSKYQDMEEILILIKNTTHITYAYDINKNKILLK